MTDEMWNTGIGINLHYSTTTATTTNAVFIIHLNQTRNLHTNMVYLFWFWKTCESVLQVREDVAENCEKKDTARSS